MKPLPIVLFVLSLVYSVSSATESSIYTGSIWAEGVSQEDGWRDIDKSHRPENWQDDMMCYAASAANLISWWQDGVYGSRLTSSAPRDLNGIWNTYLSHSKNHASGGDPLAAIIWWISGVYAPMNEQEAQRSLFNPVSDESIITLRTAPGYYFDQYGLNPDNLMNFLSFTSDYTHSYFGDLLSEGAGVSLLLKSDEGGLSHVITLLGVDYAGDGSLSRLWITDSDDGSNAIFGVDVLTASNGTVYFDEEGDIGYYAIHQMMGTGITGIHIFGVSALHPAASANWRLLPEPTTATLSLLALTGLVARRRRNR
jgi:hypothetical protein